MPAEGSEAVLPGGPGCGPADSSPTGLSAPAAAAIAGPPPLGWIRSALRSLPLALRLDAVDFCEDVDLFEDVDFFEEEEDVEALEDAFRSFFL